MASIFLSHNTKDKAAAQQLKAWLEAEKRNHYVFLDDDVQTGIKGGADWERTLYEQLRRCRV
ncbi:MAG: toll/interleukin-1 receptor domain-containing protein, partial [Nitrosomonas sp.]|nr:toll/interleukin-1 receptor domain-containing protein [Nitrosomonas sp.]